MREKLHLIASLITIFVFFTGTTTIPYLFEKQETIISYAILSNFENPISQIAITLILVPLFNIIDIWIIISIAKSLLKILNNYCFGNGFYSLYYFSPIDNDAPYFRNKFTFFIDFV